MRRLKEKKYYGLPFVTLSKIIQGKKERRSYIQIRASIFRNPCRTDLLTAAEWNSLNI